ncbi:very short patch repair endonuclease [Phyllobacterium brassicacearum]|uniref:Very short patch repair endonuclease n=1 Tax=Phyllobacterium brassicacearum TaxID=314235 RepID=A0A2P7BQ54_9HYPH|nr:very short patch repair endonuclease [Phyllobacterium brassicacearum]PSH68590.1 very short patch repair endonuclease [Phyllobacterium brassicacearum]
MPDIVDSKTRSRMMSGIRGKNTKPELLVRSALHARGFRYRIHAKNFPGQPDLLFPKHRAAIFVHGCFWHGHNCSLFRMPGTRQEFWLEKIARNQQRDNVVSAQIEALDWRQLTIWECAIRGPRQIGLDETIDRTVRWLTSDIRCQEIRSILEEGMA